MLMVMVYCSKRSWTPLRGQETPGTERPGVLSLWSVLTSPSVNHGGQYPQNIASQGRSRSLGVQGFWGVALMDTADHSHA